MTNRGLPCLVVIAVVLAAPATFDQLPHGPGL